MLVRTRVLVVHHETGRGRGSRSAVRASMGCHLHRSWPAKLARVQAFSTREEALEAAGLTE